MNKSAHNNILLLGFGKMGKAIANGLRNAEKKQNGDFAFEKIQAVDKFIPNDTELNDFEVFATGSQESRQAIIRANVILLCVKPEQMHSAIGELSSTLEELSEAALQKTYISIAAGLSLENLRAEIRGSLGLGLADIGKRVIRAMPNIAVANNSGVSCLACEEADSDAAQTALNLFSQLGKAEIIAESLFDTATAIVGCSPAFLLSFIEALADGAGVIGLPKKQAADLLVHTFLGTCKLLANSTNTPAELRDLITTPGGATYAGIEALEDGKFRSTAMRAIVKAARKSRQLGRKKCRKTNNSSRKN